MKKYTYKTDATESRPAKVSRQNRDGSHAERQKADLMAKGDKGGKKDKAVGKKRKNDGKRDKERDRYGNKYDKRNGTWTVRDKAEEEFGKRVTEAVSKERTDAELAIMNFEGKRGRPFLIAPTVITFFVRLKEFCGKSYRMTAGMVKERLEHLGIYCPTYSSAGKLTERYVGTEEGRTIMEEAARTVDAVFTDIIRSTEFRVPNDVKDAEHMYVRVIPDRSGGRARRVIIDGSGQTIVSPGEWMRKTWGGNHGKFVHHYVMTDADTMEVIAFLVTSDEVNDSPVLPLLLAAAGSGGHKVREILADGAYDNFANWDAVRERGVELTVNVRMNGTKNKDHPERNSLIRIRDAIGHDMWGVFFGYGRRWMVEVFFSVFKKIFGDNVRAHRFDMISKSMDTKYGMYRERNDILNRYLSALVD